MRSTTPETGLRAGTPSRSAMEEWKLRLPAEEVATYEMAHRWLLREGAIIGSWSIDYLMHAEIEFMGGPSSDGANAGDRGLGFG